MTTPLNLKLYILRDIFGAIVLVTHDAEMAVRVRSLFLKDGRQTEIDVFTSRRRPQSTNEIEHWCVGCVERHLVSVEATDGPSRVEEIRCELAPASALNAGGFR